MKFATYFSVSVIAAMSLIVYAIYTKEQFYPVILFLVSSKVSFVINVNLMLACAILLAKFIFYFFFGNLRDVEVEMLIDRAKFTITETLLALTIFRNEFTYSVIMFFILLLFIKSFHWLAKSRIDYLDQVMPASKWVHVRIACFLLCLTIIDVFATYSCIQYTLQHGRSSLILFGFEFGLLCISIINIMTRHGLLICDQNLTNGVIAKGFYTMIIDLICDGLRFVIYICFFALIFQFYGLPIHILREVYMAFQIFQKKFLGFIKYLNLSKNLEVALQSPNEEELSLAGDCLICREPMSSGKKLPLCGHIFHLECLRMWLQHQQSCPLCRADIPLQTPPPAVAAAAVAPRAIVPAVIPVNRVVAAAVQSSSSSSSTAVSANMPGLRSNATNTTTVVRSKEETERINKQRAEMLRAYRHQRGEIIVSPPVSSSSSTITPTGAPADGIPTSTVPTVQSSTSISTVVDTSSAQKSVEPAVASYASSSSSSSMAVVAGVDNTTTASTSEVADEKLSVEAARRLEMQKQRSAYFDKLSTSSSSSSSPSVTATTAIATATPLVEDSATVNASTAGITNNYNHPISATFFPKTDNIFSSSSTSSSMFSSEPVSRKLPFSSTLSSSSNMVTGNKAITTKLPAFYYISNGYCEASIHIPALPSTPSAFATAITEPMVSLDGNGMMTAAVFKEPAYDNTTIIGQLKKGTILFVLERYIDTTTGDTWLRMSDGWIMESCLMDNPFAFYTSNTEIENNIFGSSNAGTATNNNNKFNSDDEDKNEEGDKDIFNLFNFKLKNKNKNNKKHSIVYFALPYIPGCPAFVAMKKKLAQKKTQLFSQVDELVPRAAEVSYDYMAVLARNNDNNNNNIHRHDNQAQPQQQQSLQKKQPLSLSQRRRQQQLKEQKGQRVRDNYFRMKGSINFPMQQQPQQVKQQQEQQDNGINSISKADTDQVQAALMRGSMNNYNYNQQAPNRSSDIFHSPVATTTTILTGATTAAGSNIADTSSLQTTNTIPSTSTTTSTTTRVPTRQQHTQTHSSRENSLRLLQNQMMVMNERMMEMQQTFDDLQSMCHDLINNYDNDGDHNYTVDSAEIENEQVKAEEVGDDKSGSSSSISSVNINDSDVNKQVVASVSVSTESPVIAETGFSVTNQALQQQPVEDDVHKVQEEVENTVPVEVNEIKKHGEAGTTSATSTTADIHPSSTTATWTGTVDP